MKSKFLFVLALVLALCACSNDGAGKTNSEKAEKKIRIAHLVNGYLGDKSFHDSANLGLSDLADENKSIEFKSVEMTDDTSKHEKTLMEYCEDGTWDIIVVGTWQMIEPLKMPVKNIQIKNLSYMMIRWIIVMENIKIFTQLPISKMKEVFLPVI